MDTTILNQEDAIKWLQDEARYLVDNYIDGDYDSEATGEIIADLLEDIKLIKDNDWEEVRIEPCEMASSGVIVNNNKGEE